MIFVLNSHVIFTELILVYEVLYSFSGFKNSIRFDSASNPGNLVALFKPANLPNLSRMLKGNIIVTSTSALVLFLTNSQTR